MLREKTFLETINGHWRKNLTFDSLFPIKILTSLFAQVLVTIKENAQMNYYQKRLGEIYERLAGKTREQRRD